MLMKCCSGVMACTEPHQQCAPGSLESMRLSRLRWRCRVRRPPCPETRAQLGRRRRRKPLARGPTDPDTRPRRPGRPRLPGRGPPAPVHTDCAARAPPPPPREPRPQTERVREAQRDIEGAQLPWPRSRRALRPRGPSRAPRQAATPARARQPRGPGIVPPGPRRAPRGPLAEGRRGRRPDATCGAACRPGPRRGRSTRRRSSPGAPGCGKSEPRHSQAWRWARRRGRGRRAAPRWMQPRVLQPPSCAAESKGALMSSVSRISVAASIACKEKNGQERGCRHRCGPCGLPAAMARCRFAYSLDDASALGRRDSAFDTLSSMSPCLSQPTNHGLCRRLGGRQPIADALSTSGHLL